MTRKRRAINKKQKTLSPSPESTPQKLPVDVEDTEANEREHDMDINEDVSNGSRSDTSDDGAATANTKGQKDRKPRTKMARTLTNEEEDEVIDWMKSNRFLYDKSSFDFKNRHKKERTWMEMEQKMRLNHGDLYRWYTSLRTQYVKEVKKKENSTRSGAGAEDDIMTPRIAWLFEKFEFVKPYICQSRITRGSKLQIHDRNSDCSETSVTPKSNREGTPQPTKTSTTTASISDCLDRVSQHLAVPRSDIEKTCDFIGMLMEKMTPTCLEEFINEATCKAMEYVKQSNLERRQTLQPPQSSFLSPLQPTVRFTQQQTRQSATPLSPYLQAPSHITEVLRPRMTSSTTVYRQSQQPNLTSDYIMSRNLAASNPPVEVLRQQGQYLWAEIQPASLQPVLSDHLQPTSFSTPGRSEILASATTTVTSTDTGAVLANALQTLSQNTSSDTSFNLSDYVAATPKTPSITDA